MHIFIQVSDRETMKALTEDSLLALLPVLYDANKVVEVEQEFRRIWEQS